MQGKFWMKAFVIVPALCLAGLSVGAQQQGSSQQQTGDPVADAARKAREMKKDAPKPKRVYTDDDLKKSAPDPAPAASAAPGGSAATAQAPGDATKTQDQNGEVAWRKRFKDH